MVNTSIKVGKQYLIYRCSFKGRVGAKVIVLAIEPGITENAPPAIRVKGIGCSDLDSFLESPFHLRLLVDVGL